MQTARLLQKDMLSVKPNDWCQYPDSRSRGIEKFHVKFLYKNLTLYNFTPLECAYQIAYSTYVVISAHAVQSNQSAQTPVNTQAQISQDLEYSQVIPTVLSALQRKCIAIVPVYDRCCGYNTGITKEKYMNTINFVHTASAENQSIYIYSPFKVCDMCGGHCGPYESVGILYLNVVSQLSVS